jgi:hypothetical protein
MKHVITASVLALASCLPSAAADEGIDELCRELLDSIAADDPSLTDSGEVQITFNTMPESLYYCPGANGETTEEGTLLTFVRSFVKVKPRVDYPAKRKGDPAKTWDKLILVDAKDKPIFVKSGKDLVKIFPADMSAAAGAAIHAANCDAGGDTEACPRTPLPRKREP